MEAQYSFICNGYSNYITGMITKDEINNFTITFEVIPYTYESVNSGICSAFHRQEKKGFLLAAGKGGRVEVKIGIGTMNIGLESKLLHLEYQKRNLVTVAFWGTAGWCDLTINGILSNRVQFPRHSCMQLVTGNYYLGKYVDRMHHTNDTKHGIFHGELTVYLMQKDYLPYECVIKNHKAYRSSQNQGVEEIALYEADKYIQDIYRPIYHMMPPGKWMNEPHAPFYHEGHYHIFYQANPHAPVWDNLCWGHLISDDMVDWMDVGIALNPDQSIEGDAVDVDGCWSGSACKDADGIPLLFYTAGNNKELPNQSVAIARPDANSDSRLANWSKEGIILRQSQQDGFLGEFRDPFVWRKGDTYYMLVGTGDSRNGGGNALVYTSTDLQQFTCHGFLVDYNYESCKEVGHVWELPVLLPLRDEAGTYICDILLLCACQIEEDVVETYYFLGKFNYKSKKFEKAHELPHLLDFGNGIFTGPSGFVTPDLRSVVFTIAQGRRNHADEYTSGWAHNGGIPVALSIRGGQLQIAPIVELQEYFSKCILSVKVAVGMFQNNQQQEPALLENRIKLRANGNHLELVLDFGTDACHIIYDRSNRNFYAKYEKTGERISKCRGEVDLVSIGDEEMEMECFVDHSMIEVYLNGRKSITLRNYEYQDAYHIRVQTDCDYQLEVWEFEKH